MNCTTVEKLLPLYVEGDAAGDETAKIRAHLSSCDACSQLAEEFRASQARLHDFAVPEFGAEFYEQLRGAVMAEIHSSSTPQRPSLLEKFSSLFVWRPAAVASSLALLMVCAAVSFALYRSLQGRDAALVSLEKSMGDFKLDELPQAAAPSTEDASTPESISIPRPGSTAPRSAARQRALTGGQRKALPEIAAPESRDTATASAATQPPGTQEERETRASGQAIARMEIQTKDPNIRIIWLARKTSE
jgi:putative zinc finger protein